VNNVIVSNAELKEKLNCKQDAQVIRWLNTRGIRWDYDTKGRPITTLRQIEKFLDKETAGEVDF
jgi:hypothetical protein